MASVNLSREKECLFDKSGGMAQSGPAGAAEEGGNGSTGAMTVRHLTDPKKCPGKGNQKPEPAQVGMLGRGGIDQKKRGMEGKREKARNVRGVSG